mmetsp:Transcript_10593/g.22419  ORF Transcript_10593/g.22419 Transcript_10593/m.22419 type:complete len:471 (+) Transcript_10593:117-1529(+)
MRADETMGDTCSISSSAIADTTCTGTRRCCSLCPRSCGSPTTCSSVSSNYMYTYNVTLSLLLCAVYSTASMADAFVPCATGTTSSTSARPCRYQTSRRVIRSSTTSLTAASPDRNSGNSRYGPDGRRRNVLTSIDDFGENSDDTSVQFDPIQRDINAASSVLPETGRNGMEAAHSSVSRLPPISSATRSTSRPSRLPPISPASESTTRPSRAAAPGISSTSSGIRYGPPPNIESPPPPPKPSSPTLLSRLTSISTVASLLCVVDCTVLPLVTILLPLLGLASSPQGGTMTEALTDLSHSVALYFVLPVGSLATATGYANHRNPILCVPGIFGLLLIYISNAGHVHLHTTTATTIHDMAGGLNPLMILPHGWVHALNDNGWVHRLVNVLGCALMLGGNYLSRLYGSAGGGGGDGGGTKGSDGGGGVSCWVPGCGRPGCEVDTGAEYGGGEGGLGGVQGVESSFFQVERPKD